MSIFPPFDLVLQNVRIFPEGFTTTSVTLSLCELIWGVQLSGWPTVREYKNGGGETPYFSMATLAWSEGNHCDSRVRPDSKMP
jgi:hypothetical protein